MLINSRKQWIVIYRVGMLIGISLFAAMMAMTKIVTAYTLDWQGKALAISRWGWFLQNLPIMA
jgi:hypothetical protein